MGLKWQLRTPQPDLQKEQEAQSRAVTGAQEEEWGPGLAKWGSPACLHAALSCTFSPSPPASQIPREGVAEVP